MENPDSQPNADELLEAEEPGWGPTSRPALDPLDPDLTTVNPNPDSSQHPNPLLEGDDENERREPTGPSRDRPGPASTPGSGDEPRVADPTVASALAGIVELGAVLTGFALNGTIGRRSGAYLMREAEAQAISEPLGRIAARRMPMGDGDVNDVSDGIEAAGATIAYGARATMQHLAGAAPQPEEK